MKYFVLGLFLSCCICCMAFAGHTQDSSRSQAIELAKEARGERRQGKLREAESMYTHSLSLLPDARVYFERARVRFDLKEFEGAVTDCTWAIELGTNESSEQDFSDTAKTKLKQRKETLSDLSKSLGLELGYPSTSSERGQARIGSSEYQQAVAYNLRGMVEAKLDRNKEAVSDLSKAIELGTKHPLTFFLRGQARMELGEYQQAIFDFNESIALDKDAPQSYYMRGLARQKMEQYALADSDFSYLIAQYPNGAAIPLAYIARGQTRLELHQPDRALSDFSEALAKNKKLAVAWTFRGQAWMDLEEPTKAFEDFNRAIEIEPGEPTWYLYRALCRMEISDTIQALCDIGLAIALDPNQLDYYIIHGDCNLRLHHTAAARLDYEHALSLDPTSEEAKQRLEDLNTKDSEAQPANDDR